MRLLRHSCVYVVVLLFVCPVMTHLASSSYAAEEPVKVIFDTDMAEDVDDVGALSLLHALADHGEVQIVACMISSRNEWTGPCIDAINTYRGRPDIPIGNLHSLQVGYPASVNDKPTPSKYTEAVAKASPHKLRRSSDAPDAIPLYRELLAVEPDGSVTIVSIGFLSNLRDLLNSGKDESSDLSGEALVKKKVKQWVCMGGIFPVGKFSDDEGEYNVMMDTAASVRALNDWPTPVVFSGWEIGNRVKTGARLRETPESNPVRAAYQHYNGLKNRESWDLTAVLFAARGTRDYWKPSEPGLCLMHARVPHGYNEWVPSPNQQHRYLIEKMPPEELGKLIEDLVVAQPARKD
jgi:purine nucleosidase